MSGKMKEGLLWLDDDTGRDLTEKIGQAARRYEQKYGTPPNLCYVHPSALSDDGKVKTVYGVRVSSLRTVLLHHFWIGVEEKPNPKRRTLTQGVLL